MQRRTFLAVCGLGAVGSACARMHYVAGELVNDELSVPRGEVESRGGVLAEHPELAFPVYVHHWEGERFTAVLTRCMHRGCTVDPAGPKLVCPCHGSEYGLDGAVQKGPTQLPLIAFPVRVALDRVIVGDIARGRRA